MSKEKTKKIAIVGQGKASSALAFMLSSHLSKSEDIAVVSCSDLNIDKLEDIIQPCFSREAEPHLFKDYDIPTVDIEIKNRESNKPFYYNVPRKKKRKP